MLREKYASISIAKGEERKEIEIFKIRNEKYGVEIILKTGSETNEKRVENVTESNERITELLENIVVSVQNFDLLNDFAYEYKDKKIVI